MAHQIQNLLRGENHHLLALGERALLKELSRQRIPLEPRDRAIKARFWMEFESIQNNEANHPQMNMAVVIGRSITKESFYRHYITNPYMLAYLICPPVNYIDLLEQGLTAAMLKMLDWIDSTEIDSENILKASRILTELHRKYNSIKFRGHGGQVENEEPVKRTGLDGRKINAVIEDDDDT